MTSPLPRIVCSSVVRSVHQGESHGGVYLVDLQAGTSEQVLDWTDDTIDWEGRGGDRGLRGIAFHDGLIYLAASDEIFVYDRHFVRQGSFRNPYLHLCHEMFVDGDRLYLALHRVRLRPRVRPVRRARSRADGRCGTPRRGSSAAS